MVSVNVIPDVVGYFLLWFGLEKLATVNRWFRETHTIATGMLVVTFISFLSQISFLFEDYLGSGDLKALGIVFSLLNYAVSSGESILVALNMVFMIFLCYGLGYDLQEKNKDVLCRIMYLFSIVYIALAVVYAVNQFINLPFALWYISGPVNVIFMPFAYYITQKIEEANNELWKY